MSEQQAQSFDPTLLGQQEGEAEPGALHDEEGNLLPSFDTKHSEPFKGLLYLGALQKSFDWLGHEFQIRTLRDGEKLAVGQIIKPYADSMGAERAYACAMVAMCTMSVDGSDLPVPIGETRKAYEWGLQRFQYIKDNWFSYTTDQVFNEYVQLEDLAFQVVAAMGKASAPEDLNPSSSAI